MFGFSIRTRQNQNNAAPAAPAVPAAASPRTTSSPRVPGSPAATNSPRHVGTPGAKNSPKQVEVGEIDTRAPFRSVKAAVNLFREASNSSPKAAPTVVKKTTKAPDERVLVKETQLHLIMKELDSLKEQLRNTEATKTQAHKDLERAKRTLNELTGKLETICEAKQAAIEATELAKVRAEELEMVQKSGGDDAWKELVDNEREQYKFSAGALNFAKQELANLRQDFDAVLEAKLAAFQQVGDSQHATSVNRERESEFSKEVAALRQTLAQVKLAPLQAQQENAKLNSEREAHLESLKAAKQEADQKLKALRELEESHPAFSKTLAAKLEETNATMDVLREQLNNVKISDIADWRDASSELENSKKGLEQLHAEQVSLKILVDSLKVELENVNALRCELRSKAAETDSMAERLEFELDRSKKELEATLARAIKPEADDITPKILELSSEAERALLGAEEMKKSAETYRQDAEKARAVAQEAETNLEIALKELEEAKAAQKVADYRIHSASKKFAAEAATSSDSSSGNGRIKLSAEEYESLSNKVEELKSEADIKVATAMAQVQTLNASEKELDEKLEECMKQKEEVQAAIQETLKRAEMDEAAKLVLECELLKWRQKGHNENEVGESSSVGRSEKKIIQMN
ncbi:PREDICTED: WEB family protein At1g12150-like [Ipomoea nil]|uniref:WEB family protein At1g12150-like n=1 Tax=Ipomoea nil TaxID=35883 RepID=UPI000900C24F|nr:PREDICTED: WEB family protein At1g12150-like [Ipomoea nil]